MTENASLEDQLQAMIRKSHRCLEAARSHYEAKDFDFACSKAYYAVFHMMQAALLTHGLTYSKHAGVIGAFSERFVKTGTFPRQFSTWIDRLRRDREVGDYAYPSLIGTDEAGEDIDRASAMVKAVEEYLQRIRPASEE